MEEVISLIRKKSKLNYEINCIKRYIDAMEYDNNLKNAWEEFNRELNEVNSKLEKIIKPKLEEYQIKKSDILSQMKSHEDELYKLKFQLQDLDSMILKIKK